MGLACEMYKSYSNALTTVGRNHDRVYVSQRYGRLEISNEFSWQTGEYARMEDSPSFIDKHSYRELVSFSLPVVAASYPGWLRQRRDVALEVVVVK